MNLLIVDPVAGIVDIRLDRGSEMQRRTYVLVVDLRFRAITCILRIERGTKQRRLFSGDRSARKCDEICERRQMDRSEVSLFTMVLRGISQLAIYGLPVPFLESLNQTSMMVRLEKLLCINYSSRGRRNRLWHLKYSHIPSSTTAAVPRMPLRPKTTTKLPRKAAVCPLTPPMPERWRRNCGRWAF